MNSGYVKVYRKMEDSIVWTNSDMMKLWMMCLMKATHKDRKFLFNEQEMQLKAGEFVTGRESLYEQFNKGVSKSNRVSAITLWRYLKKFEKLEMLNIKSTNKYSVISITNWQEYQQDEQQLNNNRTTTEQQLNTNKNDKNDKNDKNTTRKNKFYEDNSVEYQLAKKLYDRILENNPEHKEPNLQKWADVIRLMIEQDKRKPEKVAGMIDWCQQDEFWSTNILSTSALRRNYDKMNAKAAKTISPKKKEVDTSWEDKMKELM